MSLYREGINTVEVNRALAPYTQWVENSDPNKKVVLKRIFGPTALNSVPLYSRNPDSGAVTQIATLNLSGGGDVDGLEYETNYGEHLAVLGDSGNFDPTYIEYYKVVNP